MSNNDIYKFRDLVAKNSGQKPITESEIRFEGSPEEARRLADEIEQYVNDMIGSMESIEHLIKHNMPREYRYMESYTFAHLKTCIGGYGYQDRMLTSFRDLIDDLQEYADNGDLDSEEE